MSILLLNSDGSSVSTNNDLRIKLWMPTMGHGSFPVEVRQIAFGVYEVSDIFFTMPGLWDIHFQIYENGNYIEEVKWSLDL